ncbi:hypothetical protein OC835_007963, partial [Tilletia horrida]
MRPVPEPGGFDYRQCLNDIDVGEIVRQHAVKQLRAVLREEALYCKVIAAVDDWSVGEEESIASARVPVKRL